MQERHRPPRRLVREPDPANLARLHVVLQRAQNIGDRTLLIFPESKRLTTGVRYWLEDAIANGTKLVCFAVVNPQRDIFLEMVEIELELPDDARIREVMRE